MTYEYVVPRSIPMAFPEDPMIALGMLHALHPMYTYDEQPSYLLKCVAAQKSDREVTDSGCS